MVALLRSGRPPDPGGRSKYERMLKRKMGTMLVQLAEDTGPCPPRWLVQRMEALDWGVKARRSLVLPSSCLEQGALHDTLWRLRRRLQAKVVAASQQHNDDESSAAPVPNRKGKARRKKHKDEAVVASGDQSFEAAKPHDGGRVHGEVAAYVPNNLDHLATFEESILRFNREGAAYLIATPDARDFLEEPIPRFEYEGPCFSGGDGLQFKVAPLNVPPQEMQHELVECSACAGHEGSPFLDAAAGLLFKPHVLLQGKQQVPLECSAFTGSQVVRVQDSAAGVPSIATPSQVPPQSAQHELFECSVCAHSHVVSFQELAAGASPITSLSQVLP